MFLRVIFTARARRGAVGAWDSAPASPPHPPPMRGAAQMVLVPFRLQEGDAFVTSTRTDAPVCRFSRAKFSQEDAQI